MGTVIGMYAATTGGSQNALAAIDIPAEGLLVGVEWAVTADLDADAEYAFIELGFGSTITLGNNDTRSRISVMSLGQATFTAGQAVVGQGNGFTKLPDLPVGIGERLYLHSLAVAGVVCQVHCNLHFDFDLDRPRARRR
jgi:hypothetical protein